MGADQFEARLLKNIDFGTKIRGYLRILNIIKDKLNLKVKDILSEDM